MSKGKNNAMSCMVYRARKRGMRIDFKQRTIYFNVLTPEVLDILIVTRLCKKYNFQRQAEIQ